MVVQQGDDTDCGFGSSVSATGLYSRHHRHGSKAPLSWTLRKPCCHYEDANGRLAFPGTFDDAVPFREDRAAVALNKKWGLIDRSGKLIVPCKFTQVHEFREGLAAASVDGKKWGYIDRTGKFVIEPTYDYAWDFASSSAPVAIAGRYFWIDKTGAKGTTQTYDGLVAFSEGLASFRRGNLWGLIDEKGIEIVPAKYSSVLVFKDGLAAFSASTGKHGFLDKSGTEVVGPLFDDARDFVDGLAAVQSNGLWGFINKAGESIIPVQFSDCSGSFTNGRCFVRIKQSPYIWIIDKTGKRFTHLPLQCRDIDSILDTPFSEGSAICHILDWNWDSNGRRTPIDRDGNQLKGFANKNIEYWKSEGLFVVTGAAH